MGHLASKDAYRRLRARLDQFPVGAPGKTTIYEILRTAFTEEEAALGARLPFRFATLGALERRTGIARGELEARLAAMAEKGLVMDVRLGDKTRYMLSPTVVGFFEFSMMRVRDDIDQKRMAELIHRYLIEEPDFAGQFREGLRAAPFRALVHEEALGEERPETYTEVLDWERASHLLDTADQFAVGLCHCRHVAHHTGHDCGKFRMESCLTLGPWSDYVLRHGFARSISREEARDLLAESRDAGLVHLGDNVQRRPAFICNCCGCCCEVLGSFKRFRMFGDAFSSNFEATVDDAACTGCRRCEKACPVLAIDIVDAPAALLAAGKKGKKLAVVDQNVCLGCGVCVLSCKDDALEMAPRPQRRIAPETAFQRVLLMAVEQGKLANLLFDPEDGLTAQTANVLLGAILRLPPAKQLLARESLRSRFVDWILSGAKKTGVPTDL